MAATDSLQANHNNQHKPERISTMNNDILTTKAILEAKLKAMNKANSELKIAVRKRGLKAFRSPEYDNARAAWRQYWDAVDASRPDITTNP